MIKKLRPSLKHTLTVASAWFLPLLLCGFVIARCVVEDGNRRLWADELFSWYPANASFGTMLSSTTDTINAAPPLYFIATWFWTAICGESPLALRLFSAVTAAAAICLMFRVLQRAYGKIAAAAALLVAFSDGEFLYASCEARFHTLILAEVALAILLYQRILAQPRPSTRLLICNAAVHAAIVMTHYLGPLYSGAILAGVLLSSLARRYNPTRAALSVMAGWLTFLPWIPIFLRHSAMGKPTFWIPVPNLQTLEAFYANYIGAEFWLLAIVASGFGVAVFLLMTFLKQKRANAVWTRAVRPRELPLLLVAPCILVVPVAVYFVSTRPGGTSIFSSRYFVSCILGSSILYAHIASRAIELRLLCEREASTVYTYVVDRSIELRLSIRKSVYRHGMLAIQVLVLTTAIFLTGIHRVVAVTKYEMGREPRPADFPVDHTPGEPVVIEHIHEFLKVEFFSKDPHRYVFAVDPEVGLAERSGGPLNHQIMAALARQFPERFGGVKSTEAFLASATSFWVKRGGTLWYSMRIEHNPHFSVDRTEENGNLLHVRRID